MTLDATFWVTISFFIFIGILFYFKVPQKVIETLELNISNISNQIGEAEKLKEDAKNILIEQEKKISNVIATGGLANVFSRDTSIFDKIDLRLTIKGLVYISSFNEDK